MPIILYYYRIFVIHSFIDLKSAVAGFFVLCFF
jgi:hypothetical protein